ncbi:hypothetical protein AB0R12_33525, partial [Streptomyces niveus]
TDVTIDTAGSGWPTSRSRAVAALSASASHRTALLGTAPGAVVAVGQPADGEAEFPLLAGRPLVGGQAAAYVCRGFVCSAPTNEVDVLRGQLTVRV